MQRNSTPLVWRPKGLSDTLDASQTFNGAMTSLQNLIPDPSTPMLWQCRPAAIRLTNFPGFTTPGFVSAMKVIGNVVYGMIASGRNAGNDEPFAYNIPTNTFTTITGITGANTPSSPASSGTWTPPTMDLIGTLLVVTHPGFTGAGGVFFGWFDLTNPAAPVWHGGNLTGAIVFATVPSFVKNFNGRAYYIVNGAQPATVFSDVLAATTVTNANQSITYDDTVPLTALGNLALFNQLGGIVQSLIVFKGVSNTYQITGDAAPAPGTLAKNSLSIITGTLGANALAQTPMGLAFVAPDGLRLIDFDARISDPIGIDGQGTTVPFIFSNVPSRVVAGCTGSLLRISVQNSNASGSPQQEYWYDLARKIWYGPHTFPASLIQPYANTFVMTPVGVSASLWQSDPVQSVTSTYVENGAQMAFVWQTAQLPDTDQITNSCITEATIDVALPATAGTLSATFLNQKGSVLDTVTVALSGTPTIWGSFVWGAALWGGVSLALAPYELQWHQPLIFSRGAFSLTGQCASGVKIGALHTRYQILKTYMNTLAAA